MTGDECAKVVNLLVSSFPAGVKGHAWTDAIADLHPGPSMAAARELRDTMERPPSIAAFLACYRKHLAAARAQREAERGAPDACALCDGTGWVEATGHNRHSSWCVAPDGCHCHAVIPCRCTRGQQARAVHERILEANAKPVT